MKQGVVLVAAGVMLAAVVAQAETFVWTGAEDAYWTNAANWTVGGAVATRFPGVHSNADMTVTWLGWTNNVDVAEFAGPSDHTDIDTRGLFSIKTVNVKGADTPKFVFGSVRGQFLPLRCGGKLTVDADVPQAPDLVGVSMGVGVCHGGEDDKVYIVNNTASTLCISNFGWMVVNPDLKPGWWSAKIYLQGSGDYLYTGQKGPAGCGWTQLGDISFENTGKLTICQKNGGWRYVYFNGPEKVELLKGASLVAMSSSGSTYRIYKSVEIFGEGTFGFSNVNKVEVTSGKTLRVLCNLTGADNTDYSSYPSYHISSSDSTKTSVQLPSGKGTYVSSKTYPRFTGIRAEMAVIGRAGESTGPLGDGIKPVYLYTKAVLAHVGEGEETDRPVVLGNADGGCVEQAGTGVLNVYSSVSQIVASTTLELRNNTNVEGVWHTPIASTEYDVSGTLTPCTLNLKKGGSGVWRLKGANAYAGTTTLEGGTLVVDAAGTLPESSKLVFAGGSLRIEGDADVATDVALGALEVNCGNVAELRVTGQATVTFAAGSRTSGKSGILNVVTDEGATVKIAGAAGTAPAWLRYRGFPCVVDANGEVIAVYEKTIAATGDQVPDADGPVAIVAAGEGGDDTLAAQAVSVGALYQYARVPSVIAMSEGEVLTAGQVGVANEAASLTVGADDGLGVLAAAEGGLEFKNCSTGGLTVNAALDASGAEGKRTTVLPGGNETTLAGGTTGGEAKALDLAIAGSTLKLTGGKTFDIASLNVLSNDATLAESTLVVDGANVRASGTNELYVGYTRAFKTASDRVFARMVVTNALWCHTSVTNKSFPQRGSGADYYADSALCVGGRSVGVLEVRDGGVITNRLIAGGSFQTYGDPALGFVRVVGGELATLGANGDNYQDSTVIGWRSYGAGSVCLERGRFVSLGTANVGVYGHGTFHQTGGTALFRCNVNTQGSGYLRLGGSNTGSGFYSLLGGTAIVSNQIGMAYTYSGDATCQIAVDGEDALFDNVNKRVLMNPNVYNGSKSRATVGLRRGTFRSAGFYANSQYPTKDRSVWTNGIGAVVFNGGTLRLGDSGKDVFKCDCVNDAYGVDAYVCEGGATVDTDGKTGNFSTRPFAGATGRGVASVDLAEPLENVLSVPQVIITGDGTGAVAVVEYDADAKRVSGVRVVTPGSGYSSASAKICHSQNSVVKSGVPCTLGQNGAGQDFTKKGEGDFTFMAENTYGGKTILEGGTLVLGVPNALPATTTIVPRGGVIEATAENFPAALTVDVSELDPEARAVRFAKVTEGELAAPPEVTIVGSEPGQDWHVTSAGGVFKVGVRKGMLLIVK